MGGYHDFCDEYINASPFELLEYVKHADYIITDTFHGTIFSIINHKPFVSLIRESHNGVYGNKEKLTDLLSRLELTERGISNSADLFEIIDQPIDYNRVESIRQKEIKKTHDYLKRHLD